VPIITRVTVYPDVLPENGGGFLPTSFSEFLPTDGCHVHVVMPGLDPTWQHVVIDAMVAPDRASAELTLRSEPVTPLRLDRNLRIIHSHPAARVRAHDQDGNQVAEGTFDAPLQPGQLVELAGERYQVAYSAHEAMWPHRDPVTGAAEGIDWQHVTLCPAPEPAHYPAAAPEPR
jgi:hypothetical protein